MQYFYKYRPSGSANKKCPEKNCKVDFSPNFTDDILLNRRFYLSSPNDFDDPFDCQTPITFDTDSQEFQKRMYEIVKQREPNTSRQIIRKNIRETKKHPKYLLDHMDKHIRGYRSALGVVCLSTNNKDIRMWSHYADCHRGICLQFDFSAATTKIIPQEVIYDDNCPKVDFFKTPPDELNKAVLLRKAKSWEGQEEWRVIRTKLYPPKERYLHFPKETLTGIIFGCKASEETRQHYFELCKSRFPKISFYRATILDGSYALDIVADK